MSQDRWDDLYDRLTSRKLALALLSIAFAIWGYHNGSLTGEQLQQAVMIAVGTFSVAEGAADAVAAYRPRPSSPEQTVNVDTKPPVPTGADSLTPEQRRQIVADLRAEMMATPADPDPLITRQPTWLPPEPTGGRR